MTSLLEDHEHNPDLFDLRTPVAQAELERLEEALGMRLPPSFRAVLEHHGQGIFFDNESILGAHELDDGLGDMVGVNRELRDTQGLPAHLVVFHLGLGGLHAFDALSGGPEFAVVALDEETLEPGPTYAGFDDWYREVLRREYAAVLDLD